ncbi:hypothetical protein EVAR_26711_1 [Eumeta japonica]|uniref:Uncharacterized protein n=1 Tax=Eumeta variegata TaxID=151549 RepID=A0A4C1ZPF2_EUMVA|nr:hypothetical protein EVAR_26711_1 [Eumeta japonica]
MSIDIDSRAVSRSVNSPRANLVRAARGAAVRRRGRPTASRGPGSVIGPRLRRASDACIAFALVSPPYYRSIKSETSLLVTGCVP